jgi:hypothetical protein
MLVTLFYRSDYQLSIESVKCPFNMTRKDIYGFIESPSEVVNANMTNCSNCPHFLGDCVTMLPKSGNYRLGYNYTILCKGTKL